TSPSLEPHIQLSIPGSGNAVVAQLVPLKWLTAELPTVVGSPRAHTLDKPAGKTPYVFRVIGMVLGVGTKNVDRGSCQFTICPVTPAAHAPTTRLPPIA